MRVLLTSINYWAILATVVVNFAISAVWFSPPVFLNPWMKVTHVSKAKMDAGMPRALLVDLVCLTTMSFVMFQALHFAEAHTLEDGLVVAFMMWLGFVATVQIGVVTYEFKPFNYFVMISGYRLVTMLTMGAILTLWG